MHLILLAVKVLSISTHWNNQYAQSKKQIYSQALSLNFSEDYPRIYAKFKSKSYTHSESPILKAKTVENPICFQLLW